MDYRVFVDTVARRAGVSPEQAAKLSEATLETLTERITGGEARDLAAQLPKPLKDNLRKSRETARSFDVAEFLSRISARAGTDDTMARNGATAVLSTVGEAVTRGEFKDMLSQLPDEYGDLLEPSVAPAGVPPRRG